MTVVCCSDHHHSSPPILVMKFNGKKKNCRSAGLNIPCVDMSLNKVVNSRWKVSETIVKACEEFGFFNLRNHGVPKHLASRLERESVVFFEKPAREKQRAGPPDPFGYGCRNIGFNGDKGELEYLLLEANPVSINQRSTLISDRPQQFSRAVNEYVGAVRELACEILDLAEEGLYDRALLPRTPNLQDQEHYHRRSSATSVLSKLIRDANSDSCVRINRYPPVVDDTNADVTPNPSKNDCFWDVPAAANNINVNSSRIEFGEHSDPQILTILRSNDVPGLQICSPDGLWIPVSPDPDHLCVFVGDAFQALTNGRFKSVRHRVVANSGKPRISTMYFGAPALNAWISPLPHLVSTDNPGLYRDFTWEEFKKAVYSSRLADHRLHLFLNRASYLHTPSSPSTAVN